MATTDSETQQIVARIDAIIQELEALRRQLTLMAAPPTPNLTAPLFGALGHGTWDEYDPDLDWTQYSPWPLRPVHSLATVSAAPPPARAPCRRPPVA